MAVETLSLVSCEGKFEWDGTEAMSKTLKRYLQSLKWDGIPRIDAIATEVLHAKPTKVLREFFKSAVQRAFEPGCKVDRHLVLVGPTGIGKTSFFQKLFEGRLTTLQMTEAPTSWGVEFGPAGLLTETLKAYLSATRDLIRPGEEILRGCVFVGTTEARDILTDESGGRRFWVIECDGQIEFSSLDRDQLWAEAVAMFAKDMRS